MKFFGSNHYKPLPYFIVLLCSHLDALARGGGAGGHGSHSSGGHSGYGSGGYGGGGYIGIGSGGGSSFIVILIIIIVVIYLLSKKNDKANTQRTNDILQRNAINNNRNSSESDIVNSFLGTISSLFDTDKEDENSDRNIASFGNKKFPDGLTPQKISTAFLDIQSAWQSQDLGKVRKWISDGVYQRFIAQFEMMQKLTQRNQLDNIQICDISVANIYSDRFYDCVDIAITFSMDDLFICDNYPSLNESYLGDEDTEYWTFIRRKDRKSAQTDLYNSDNCPNCGASLDNKLGEVSRCPNCKTLVNNASYDWILSEITQDQDYNTQNNYLLTDANLQQLVQHDPLFSVQRVEDIASNVFMQIMEVLSGDNDQKINRFANTMVAQQIVQLKKQNDLFVFDRLYLNEVTLDRYATDNDNLNLYFRLKASYKRVRLLKGKALWLDSDFVDGYFELVLSKSLAALQKQSKEIAYSYECGSCGAPFNDTTQDTCSYCGAPVVDLLHNWVLTSFTSNS